MDNITPLVPSTNSPCIVTLNPFQNAYYHQSSIEIHAPNGEHLETLGADAQKENNYTNNMQLRDQICLVETLLGHINQDIELPRQAVSGLTDLLFRMQELCDERIKK
ncbi:MAG: hypothetical protein K0Q67_1905 [Cellvibrio sp.]|jgi:hypothetical protein|nr:hypothetical protein [Cellvibrio sp.]